MIRGTTTPLVLDFSGQDVDFTTADTIEVTLEQKDVLFTLTPTVMDAQTLSVSLTQEQSLAFDAIGMVYPLAIQVNFLKDGIRYASYVTRISMGEQINDEVIS